MASEGVTVLPALILIAGAAALALAIHFYVRGEIRVPGRPFLLGLRIAVLLVVVALLLDLRVPGQSPASDRAAPTAWMLVDAELSLLVPGPAGPSLWDEARSRSEGAAAAGLGVALTSPGASAPEGVDPSTLPSREPHHPPGDLVEGVIRLGEIGADSVIVVSSLRRPSRVLERLREEAPVPVRLERLGGTVRNAGVGELVLPSTVREGEEADGSLSIFGEGGAPGDSVVVDVEREGELLHRIELPLPGAGESVGTEFTIPGMADTGRVRYVARVRLEGDVFPVDDARVRWVQVGEPEGGIVLLSLRPDWEPRYLLPVLRAVTGLDGEGYLRLGPDRFLPLVEGGEGARPVPTEELRRRVEGADVLVLHGTGADVPGWLTPLVRQHRRVLHLPTDREGAVLAGVDVGDPSPGEWVPDPDLPSSPVAPFLGGLPLGGLPPLSTPFPPDGEPDGTAVLHLRGPQGVDPLPALLLREEEGRRGAIALASGFWRWGSRDGQARTAYRSLWGGVANWLLAPLGDSGEDEVRPVEIVQPRGQPLRWYVPEAASGARLMLISDGGAGEEAHRATLTPGADGVAITTPMAPDLYRFEVHRTNEEDGPPLAEGWVEVERWAGSLQRAPLDLDEDRIEGAPAESGVDRGEGRPLRTHPAPYLLALLLLCVEWVGRRRVGLR